MKEKFKNIKILVLPADVKEVFALIEEETNGFTDKAAIAANQENFDKAYALVKEKFPEALRDYKEIKKEPDWKITKSEWEKRSGGQVDNDQYTIGKKPMSFGVADMLDGEIEQVIDYNRALKADFHHNHWVKPKFLKKIEKDAMFVFWFVDGEPTTMEGNLPSVISKKIKNQIKPYHKELIRQAIESEKPVPENVLKDYPDLKKGKPKKEKSEYVEKDFIMDEIEGLNILLTITENKTERQNIKDEIEGLDILMDL